MENKLLFEEKLPELSAMSCWLQQICSAKAVSVTPKRSEDSTSPEQNPEPILDPMRARFPSSSSFATSENEEAADPLNNSG